MTTAAPLPDGHTLPARSQRSPALARTLTFGAPPAACGSRTPRSLGPLEPAWTRGVSRGWRAALFRWRRHRPIAIVRRPVGHQRVLVGIEHRGINSAQFALIDDKPLAELIA